MASFEKTLQKNVLQYLKERGCYAVNIHGNEFQSGVPDILACVCGRFVAFELKSDIGVLSPVQKINLRNVRKSGGVGEEIRDLQTVKEWVEILNEQREAEHSGTAVVLSTNGVSNRGRFLIDPEDAEEVSKYNWYLVDGNSTAYVHGHRKGESNKDRKWVYLHRLVMGVDNGVLVDHINHDGLDCRKTNLRLATPTENQRNKKSKTGKSRFKGVSASNGKWKAHITLGHFDTEEEAGREYNKASQYLFGEFGYRNDELSEE